MALKAFQSKIICSLVKNLFVDVLVQGDSVGAKGAHTCCDVNLHDIIILVGSQLACVKVGFS